MSEFFKCAICGKIVKVIAAGKGQLVCCDQPMGHFFPTLNR